jgi:hypothetical protein
MVLITIKVAEVAKFPVELFYTHTFPITNFRSMYNRQERKIVSNLTPLGMENGTLAFCTILFSSSI